MPIILHLSDLHLLANPREQQVIFDELVAAVGHVREHYAGDVGLLAITGDVFDSSRLDPKVATHRFVELHKEICRALHNDVPTVLVPGNHDRRKNGLFGPHRGQLFDALQTALGERAWVHGCNIPFLSEVIPAAYHRLPLWVVAYDSTYLPRGLLSAGGALRQEDLLYAAAQIGERNPEWPVLFLLHHHLVPTPLTDLGTVELDENAPAVLRWGIQTALPKLIAHADREELTMTALGAGTALSTLHTLGRAVLALHGHKHYASARLLHGLMDDQGDVLLVSAGSAGIAQSWNHGGAAETARLWPSFNIIELEGDSIAIDTLSFAWKEEGVGQQSRRALVRARRTDSRWHAEPLRVLDIEDPGPRLDLNRTSCRFVRSHTPGRWDYACEREVRVTGVGPPRYVETVEGLSDGVCVFDKHGATSSLPAAVHLRVGDSVHFFVKGGVLRTLREAERTGQRPPPFAHVALLNRYASKEAVLAVSGLGKAASEAFASATDLGTGLESPMRLQADAGSDEVVCTYSSCPPRTLLRIYWRLERE